MGIRTVCQGAGRIFVRSIEQTKMIGAERGMLLLYPEDGAPGPELRVSRNISTNEPGRNLAEISRGILERLIVDDALREISLKDRSSGVFTQEDLEVLDLLGNQAGVSIANARLYTKAVTEVRSLSSC
ncbi:MAG: hypothetical protein ACLFST_14100 [Spirochaetia bacterium]